MTKKIKLMSAAWSAAVGGAGIACLFRPSLVPLGTVLVAMGAGFPAYWLTAARKAEHDARKAEHDARVQAIRAMLRVAKPVDIIPLKFRPPRKPAEGAGAGETHDA